MVCENGHPNGSVYPLNDDSGIYGWVCINCGDGVEHGKSFKGDDQ